VLKHDRRGEPRPLASTFNPTHGTGRSTHRSASSVDGRQTFGLQT